MIKKLFILSLFFTLCIGIPQVWTASWRDRIHNVEGFEIGDTTKTIEIGGQSGGTLSVQSGTVRTGTYALRINPSNSFGFYGTGCEYDSKGRPPALDEDIRAIRFYFRIATAPASDFRIFSFKEVSGANEVVNILLTSGRQLKIGVPTSEALGGSPTTLDLNTWYKIDFFADSDATTSNIRLWINDILENTEDGTFLDMDTLVYGAESGTETTDLFFDDVLVVGDGISITDLPIDPGEVVILRVTGNGVDTDWNGSFTDVDELPPDDATTFINNTDAFQNSTFALTDGSTAGVNGIVNGVALFIKIRENVSGATDCGVRMRSGTSSATINDTAADNVGDNNWTIFGLVEDKDPDSSATWTVSDLDDLQGGVVGGVESAQVDCTIVWAEVDYTSPPPPPAVTKIQGAILQGATIN